jgi:hypothetical protein
MTFLEALYGSQYAEIKNNDKDGSKGRLNGNLFLTAFCILIFVFFMLLLSYFLPFLGKGIKNAMPQFFNLFSAKGQGKILAVVFGGLFYFIITKTVGAEDSFNRFVDSYLAYPETVRNTANKRLLFPFFILLALVFILAFLI